MTNESGLVAASSDSAPNNSDVVIDFPYAFAEPGGKGRRRCSRACVSDQLFIGPELAKLMFNLCCVGIFATPVIYYNQILPEHYLYLISILLFVGFFALLYAIALHKTFPAPAVTLGLIGAACVVVVIPTITAGLVPKHAVFVWVLFLLVLVVAVLFVALDHIAEEGVHGVTEGNHSDATSEIEVGKGRIEPPIATNEIKLEIPQATEVELGSEDDAQKAEFCNSDVLCYVRVADESHRCITNQ